MSNRKRLLLAAIALIVSASVHAQVQSNTRSVSIQIVAVVPTVLRLSLDFCAGTVAQVNAYLPPKNDAEKGKTLASPSRFEIRENAVIELGDARLFSNTNGSYSVDVYSANGGALRNESGSSGSAIPYNLTLGGRPARNRDGAFSFQTKGKTERDGSAMKVALAIASVPASAVGGNYSDQLMFSLSAN